MLKHILLLIALCQAEIALAYEVIDKDLEIKIADSELVAIGTVISTYKKPTEFSEGDYAVIKITNVMKGGEYSQKQIDVLYRGSVSELYAVCCRIETRYLLFLEELPSSVFRSVNGRYGIYRMSRDGNLYIGDQPADFNIADVQDVVNEKLGG